MSCLDYSWIRGNVFDNVERGRQIAEVQKHISVKVAANITAELEEKVTNIVNSPQPQAKVFKVRKHVKKSLNIDFPLKDSNGVLQVSKAGVDKIINDHFVKVFAQNGIPSELVWQEYWKYVDEVFDLMDEVTSKVYSPIERSQRLRKLVVLYVD